MSFIVRLCYRRSALGLHWVLTLTFDAACPLSMRRSYGGMGILVKEDYDPERPQETNASFSLRNPDEVQLFLSMLVAHGKSPVSA